jgi:hypothetical protein
MRRSTTSAGTDASRTLGRRRLGSVLAAELICAVFVVAGPSAAPTGPAVAAPAPFTASVTDSSAQSRVLTTPDGRTAELVDLGTAAGRLDRIAAELPGATAAVDGFWGEQWTRQIQIVIAGTDDQFATLAGGGADVAATTTAERIMFSPAAAGMTPDDLRIVLRHEMFHYASRAETAADAPMWLTEGVADYVGRPAPATPVALPASLPTDAQLATPGPQRSGAYDRAWQFATWVAQTHGPAALRALYRAACGPGHTDVPTAMRTVLGGDPLSQNR